MGVSVVLFGATGMIGSGVLLECLDDPGIESILSIGRGRVDVDHPKLEQRIHANLADAEPMRPWIEGRDACFFCVGVSSAGMREPEYTRLTFDLTMSVANVWAEVNRGTTFCYVSGEGTDSTEKGRSMWARLKGRTENALLRLPIDAYMFRPGFILPMKGVRSKTPLYRALYAVAVPLHPLLRRVFARHMTTTQNLGRAMIRVATKGSEKRILENADIDVLAGR
jgi:uncharacterized protein YbjT (DUF2867 family)